MDFRRVVSIWKIMTSPREIEMEDPSTVKYTIALKCIGLSESASTLYTNFEFCEGKNHKHLKKPH